MLGRPAPTGEMVVPLVTFGFFPRVLSSFSPHVQRQILGLGGELSQLRLWENREETEVMMSDRTAGWVPWGTGLSGIKWGIVMGSSAPRSRLSLLRPGEVILGCSLKHRAEETWAEPYDPRELPMVWSLAQWLTSSGRACSSLPAAPGTKFL